MTPGRKIDEERSSQEKEIQTNYTRETLWHRERYLKEDRLSSHPGIAAPPISIGFLIIVLVPRPNNGRLNWLQKQISVNQNVAPSDDEIVALRIQSNSITLVMDVPSH